LKEDEIMGSSLKIPGFREDISDVKELIQADISMISEISEMASGCLNYLDCTPDPSKDFECKFSIAPLGIPYHVPFVPSNDYGFDPTSLGDTDLRMDMVYPYMREIAGITKKSDAEIGVRSRAESYKNEKGLCEINPSAFTGTPVEGKWVSSWGAALNILFYCDEFERTGESKWLEEAFKITTTLISLALSKENMLYMPYGVAPWKDGQWLLTGWMEAHQKNYSFIIEPLVRLYEISKDPSILETANCFAEGILKGVQPNQGKVAINSETGEFEQHVHIHTRTIWGMAHLGVVSGDARYLLWAKRAYEFVISKGTDFGWYPEHYPQAVLLSETCVVGDMTAIAYWLSIAGFREEYDRMERTYRNYLRTAQFFVTPDFESLFRNIYKENPLQELESALEKLKEIEGGFLAQISLNDLITHIEGIGKPGLFNGMQMMGCCPPSGMLALYYIWKAIVRKVDNSIYINMSITARTKYADIISDYSSKDRLVITAHIDSNFYVRPPVWAKKIDIRVYLNRREISTHWSGYGAEYIKVENVKKGDKICLYYPLISFKQTFTANSVLSNSEKTTVLWIGNNVISIVPKGKFLPIYV
jgi:hypothetical protein